MSGLSVDPANNACAPRIKPGSLKAGDLALNSEGKVDGRATERVGSAIESGQERVLINGKTFFLATEIGKRNALKEALFEVDYHYHCSGTKPRILTDASDKPLVAEDVLVFGCFPKIRQAIEHARGKLDDYEVAAFTLENGVTIILGGKKIPQSNTAMTLRYIQSTVLHLKKTGRYTPQ